MTHSSGCRLLDIEFPLLYCYPAESPESPARIGPYEIRAAMDAPPAEGRFPLAVISHGSGGSPLVYRGLALHLARNGFRVAVPEHPGNNRNDNSRANTIANLIERPRHIRQVIGHSMGGYTALALAGGRPTAFARETPDGRVRELEVEHDPRVNALVLLAPAAAWFLAEESLRAVRAPILMLTAEHDPHTPPGHAEIVKRGVSSPLEHRVIANAGHFSFLGPFPPAITSPGFPPSQDPPGFDRAAFHEQLNADVLAFLRSALQCGHPEEIT